MTLKSFLEELMEELSVQGVNDEDDSDDDDPDDDSDEEVQ